MRAKSFPDFPSLFLLSPRRFDNNEKAENLDGEATLIVAEYRHPFRQLARVS